MEMEKSYFSLFSLNQQTSHLFHPVLVKVSALSVQTDENGSHCHCCMLRITSFFSPPLVVKTPMANL